MTKNILSTQNNGYLSGMKKKLFLSVLLYNFAIRFLPWVMSKLGSFLGYLCGKAKDLFLYLRRECYQL